jgi:thioredoxin 1
MKYMPSQIKEIDETNFYQFIKEHKIAIIDFWAKWCIPCHYMTMLVLEPLAKKYEKGIPFAKVDVDENSELAERLAIMSIPTIILFKDGQEVDRIVGFWDNVKETVERKIRKAIILSKG